MPGFLVRNLQHFFQSVSAVLAALIVLVSVGSLSSIGDSRTAGSNYAPIEEAQLSEAWTVDQSTPVEAIPHSIDFLPQESAETESDLTSLELEVEGVIQALHGLFIDLNPSRLTWTERLGKAQERNDFLLRPPRV